MLASEKRHKKDWDDNDTVQGDLFSIGPDGEWEITEPGRTGNMVMTNAEKVLIAAASFEDRSTVWVREFLASGGNPEHVFFADVFETATQCMDKILPCLYELGVCNVDSC